VNVSRNPTSFAHERTAEAKKLDSWEAENLLSTKVAIERDTGRDAITSTYCPQPVNFKG
jgi:hypothetical protein